jgi:hypothetical protein
MVCYKKIDVTVLMVFVLKSTIGYGNDLLLSPGDPLFLGDDNY